MSFLLLLSVGIAGCYPAEDRIDKPEQPSATEDRRAASFTVPALNREGVLDWTSYKGNVVVLSLCAAWSGPCRYEVPRLSRISEEFKDRGVSVIGLAVDKGAEENVTRRVVSLNASYPIGRADDALQREYGGIRAVPTTFLIDRNGHIVNR